MNTPGLNQNAELGCFPQYSQHMEQTASLIKVAYCYRKKCGLWNLISQDPLPGQPFLLPCEVLMLSEPQGSHLENEDGGCWEDRIKTHLAYCQ